MPASRIPRVELAVTPRFDVFYALYSLSSGASSSIDAWKQAARRRQPDDFERAARRVAPLPIFWPLLADAAQGAPGAISFDEVLATIAESPAEDLQRNILSGIFHDRRIVTALVAQKRNLKSVTADEDLLDGGLLEHFGLRPFDPASPAVKAITSLLTRPEWFRDEVVLLLRRFWDHGFERDWAALEPRLRADAERITHLRADSTLRELGRELKLPVEFDDETTQLRPNAGSPIGYDRIDRCYLVPSAFNTRKWWAKYETAKGRMTLYLPIVRTAGIANAIVEERQPIALSSQPPVSLNAESVFRALGDTTRYAIASILARTPVSSAELARQLKVSKPTITHHVQALRAAGLLSEAFEGGSTRLSLREDTLAALSQAAVQQLFASKGDLALTTTRKRRGG
jgi:DNA-binding transcriptional ArsR family regulator